MMNIIFIWVPLLFLLTSLLLKTKNLLHNNNNKVNGPSPSPPKLPLLGHLHLIGSHPHHSLWNLSRTHGPIMLLKLGSVPTVVISSAAAARELFKHHDLASCSRPRLTGSGRFSYNFQDLNLSPYGERWRELRKIFMLELFSTKRVQSFQHIREEEVVDDRINFKATSGNDENIVDVLLRMERDSSELDGVKFTLDCVKALIMDIFLAGVETGETTIVWAMTELIRNPKVMKKLQDEIRSNIKEDQVKESDLEKLKYLRIVMKEVLRLHPPVPLLLPRESMSHFQLNGYDIHPKTHIHVNVWAIGRDPESWTNPLEFFPERFMESNIDYKGQNFELIPFGAGRRICPGMNMAIITMELVLANMILCFNWKLPNGMKEEDVDMDEGIGLSASKKLPLRLVPIPYFS
ncbi:cytochrome P450 71B9-like isoform X2 [Benincasa hispida]|uniref:cytochrome P450 71B9-like isoform X2 n=1 Tax=Benincasa hispida TaxID=102211 RepID=UPI0019018BD5|nr:cytochrome P450 71B9-like isoform X2 [Benincasa hispida]